MLDFTQLATFIDCPQRYAYQFMEGLRKRREQEDAYDLPRTFGQAIHEGLETYYRGNHHVPAGLEAVRRAMSTCTVPENEQCRTAANALTLLKSYVTHYFTQDKDWKIVAVEASDTIDIGGPSPWLVKCDLIIELPSGYWAVEHKTTGKAFNESYWRQFEPNSQVSSQAFYVRQKYGQCSGVIVNGLSLGYRTRAYKGEPAGFHCAFQRQIFNRTPEQLLDWQKNTVLWMSKLKTATEQGVWGKNERACGYCQFRPVCISVNDPQVKEILMEQVENPLAYQQGATAHE